MTALQVNGSAAAATTLAAAGKMFSATGGTSGNTSTKVGTSTQFKQIFAKGTTTNQTGVASIPAPTDSNFNGWMWDVTTLEGQEIAAGTWTPTIHLLASTGATVTPTVQWFKRSSGGVYTSIGSVAGSSIALTTSSQLLVFTPPSLALMDFVTGDKLVMWLWVNQTAGGAANSTISVVEATSGSSAGVTSEAQAVTPGYGPTPVALSVTLAGIGTLSLSIYRPTILADSPIRYYRLGETSGTVANDLGSGAQNGTIQNAGTGVTLNQTGLLPGDVNTSMLFTPGSAGYITLPTTGLPTGASAWSMETWVKMPGTLPSGFPTIMCFGTANTNQMAILMYRASSTAIEIDDWSGTVLTWGTAPVANGVYHLVATYDGTTLRLYVNGALVNSVAKTFNITAGSAQIGNDSTADYWSGNGDDVAWYSAALTLTQVASHYAAGTAPGGLLLTTALTSTLASVGTLTGTLSIPGAALSAECDGVGSLAGALSLTTSLNTALAGVGALSEILSANTALTSTLAGVGALTGTIQLTTALSTTLAGVGTLSETFSLAAALNTTFAGVGALNETLTATTSLTASLVGVGTLTETLSLATTLANTLAGVGTLSGTLSTSANVALSVTLAGVGILSGTPGLSTALTTSMVGVGTLAETFTLTTALTTTLASSGTLVGTLSLSTALITALVGSGSLNATISEQTSLTTNMVGAGILTSTIMLTTSLASTLTGTGTLAGVFSVQVALFLNCVGISTLVGTMTAGVPGVPGTATALDQLIALSLLGNQLVVIAGISDRFVANATLTDTLG